MSLDGRKLYTDGLPELAEEDLSVRAVVKWRAAALAWYRTQGLEEYTTAEELSENATEEQRRMGLRYIAAAVKSPQLRNAIARNANSGPEAWTFIAREFLHGRDEQAVLHELLSECTMTGTNKTPLTFRFEFEEISQAMDPPLPQQTLCGMFASRIPSEYENVIGTADISPGRANLELYARAIAQGINELRDRNRKREATAKVYQALAEHSALSTKVDQLCHAFAANTSTSKRSGNRTRYPKKGPCHNCDDPNHHHSECTKPKARCTHPLCKDRPGHLPKYCFYYHPELCKDPSMRSRIEKKLADFNTTSSGAHRAHLQYDEYGSAERNHHAYTARVTPGLCIDCPGKAQKSAQTSDTARQKSAQTSDTDRLQAEHHEQVPVIISPMLLDTGSNGHGPAQHGGGEIRLRHPTSWHTDRRKTPQDPLRPGTCDALHSDVDGHSVEQDRDTRKHASEDLGHFMPNTTAERRVDVSKVNWRVKTPDQSKIADTTPRKSERLAKRKEYANAPNPKQKPVITRDERDPTHEVSPRNTHVDRHFSRMNTLLDSNLDALIKDVENLGEKDCCWVDDKSPTPTLSIHGSERQEHDWAQKSAQASDTDLSNQPAYDSVQEESRVSPENPTTLLDTGSNGRGSENTDTVAVTTTGSDLEYHVPCQRSEPLPCFREEVSTDRSEKLKASPEITTGSDNPAFHQKSAQSSDTDCHSTTKKPCQPVTKNGMFHLAAKPRQPASKDEDPMTKSSDQRSTQPEGRLVSTLSESDKSVQKGRLSPKPPVPERQITHRIIPAEDAPNYANTVYVLKPLPSNSAIPPENTGEERQDDATSEANLDSSSELDLVVKIDVLQHMLTEINLRLKNLEDLTYASRIHQRRDTMNVLSRIHRDKTQRVGDLQDGFEHLDEQMEELKSELRHGFQKLDVQDQPPSFHTLETQEQQQSAAPSMNPAMSHANTPPPVERRQTRSRSRRSNDRSRLDELYNGQHGLENSYTEAATAYSANFGHTEAAIAYTTSIAPEFNHHTLMMKVYPHLGTLPMRHIHVAATAVSDKDTILIDSGATTHLECRTDLFTSKDHVNPRLFSIQIGDGRTFHPDFIGTVEYQVLGTKAGSKMSEPITIRREHVLCSSQLSTALFSPRNDWKTHGTRTSFEDTCTLTLTNGTTIRFHEKDGAYLLTRQRPSSVLATYAHSMTNSDHVPVRACRVHATSPEVQLWHRRLGHPSFKAMTYLPQTTVGTHGLENINVAAERARCSACPRARLKRAAHPEHFPAQRRKGPTTNDNDVEPAFLRKTRQFGQVVYMDTCGPIRIPSFSGGHHHISTFVDSHTDFWMTYTMSDKTEQPLIERRFRAEMSQYCGMDGFMQFHSDNGSEYVSNAQLNLFESDGIHRTFSVPYTPEQNNRAENSFWIILSIARAMLIHSGVPREHWAAAVSQACYVRNRMPKQRRGDKQIITPYEMLNGRKPNIRYIRVFGCVAYVLQERQFRESKIDELTYTGFCMGNARYSRGWLIWVPGESQYRVAHTVRFDESKTYRIAVNALGPYHGYPQRHADDEPGDIDQEPADMEYEVEEIIASRTEQDGSTSYLIRWQGFDESENTWEPIEHLEHCPELLQRFESKQIPESNTAPQNTPSDHTITASSQIDDTPSHQESAVADTDALAENSHQALHVTGWRDEPTVLQAMGAHIPESDTTTEHDFDVFTYLAVTDEKIIHGTGSNEVSSIKIPRSYREAMESADAPKWREAMNKEMDSQRDHEVFELVPRSSLPSGRRPIKGKWVLTIKLSSNGTLERYKARYVCKGFSQVAGVDYLATCSDVVHLESLRFFLAHAAQHGLQVTSFDISTAFLTSKIDTTIYVEQPEGYVENGPDDEAMVWKLKRSLYGLKQSPLLFQQHLRKELMDMGFIQSNADHCVYKHVQGDSTLYMCTHVDDCLISCGCNEHRQHIIKEVERRFQIKDEGITTGALGIRIIQSPEQHTITINQELYIDEMVLTFAEDLSQAPERHSRLPLTPVKIDLSTLAPLEKGDPEIDQYLSKTRKLLGKLLWVATVSRPDISFAVSKIAKCAHAPSKQAYDALIDILKYLRTTKHFGITYGPNEENARTNFSYKFSLQTKATPQTRLKQHSLGGPGQPNFAIYGFSDASHGPKPSVGYVLFAGGGPFAWKANSLSSTPLSTCEGEWMAASRLAMAIQAVTPLAAFFGVPFQGPVPIYCDNYAAVMLSETNLSSRRMKHVMTRLQYLKERCEDGEIIMHHVRTDAQIADIFTKALKPLPFHTLREQLVR